MDIGWYLVGLIIIIYLLNSSIKRKRKEKRLVTMTEDEKVRLYFDPERKKLQQMQTSKINGGKIAGSVAKGTFSTVGTIVSMTGLPGGSIVKSAFDGMGKIASKGIEAGSNALGRVAMNAEYQNVFRGISDEELDVIMKNHVINLGLVQNGLDSLMLDESQISELPPVCLDNYYFDENNENLFVVRGKDGVIRTSCYQANCLYFTAKQLCIYQYTLDLSNGINPQGSKTKEYFWKDISEFSFENLNSMGNGQKCFVIKTSGGEYYCVYKESPETTRALKGMNFYFRNIKENA